MKDRIHHTHAASSREELVTKAKHAAGWHYESQAGRVTATFNHIQ